MDSLQDPLHYCPQISSQSARKNYAIGGISSSKHDGAKLDSVRHEVLAEVRQFQNVVIDAISNTPQVENEIIPPPQIQTANAVTTNPEMSGLLTLITNLTTTVQGLERSVNNGCSGRGNGGRGYSGRGCGQSGRGGRGGCNHNNNSIFGRHPRWRRTAVYYYCWSHGACNHVSGDCSNPLPGHQNAATFKKRMNGCNHYCQPVTDNNNNTNVNPYINSIYKYNDSTDCIIAKVDSGTTTNYWRECDKHVLSNRERVDGPSVTLPNNSIIKSKE